MKFAICQELFVDWTWDRQCEFAAQLGYTGMEVAPFTLAGRAADVTATQRQELREIAAAKGVEIIGLHWLLAKTEGLHLTTADADVRRATSQYLVELGELCGDLGGTVMVFGSPHQRSLELGMSRDQAMENAAEVIRNAMPAIGDRGVHLLIEPLTTKETDFINTCADGAELIDRVGHPNFALHQDVKAMLGEEFKGITRHFHVNDSNLLGPGMGETDYHPIFDALQKSGYDGWVSVEVFDYSPGAEHICEKSMNYMTQVLADLEARGV
ncbi:5-keto-L-gluconate epimerase (Bifunctional nonphosphorylated sugar isomerase) (D-erythrose/D-threose isomerase) (L-ribulose 3-epimerase) (R3E) (Nonphosphorylated sugar 3-epimerase) (Nonphosphorylated sugar aldose-ketose isomerase) [Durusdinium trenchii]|uniref:Xylose isomerase-like TIM barrel domain-containing protein n=1 Tax=Durusdinium trenchii TaxID=1381693 RepID=A0ABP0JFI7_9DINO